MVAREKRRRRTIRARFPSAEDVYVLGEFNNWSTAATPMQRVREDVWEATLPPAPRANRFCFFVWEQGKKFGRVCRPEERDDAKPLQVAMQ